MSRRITNRLELSSPPTPAPNSNKSHQVVAGGIPKVELPGRLLAAELSVRAAVELLARRTAAQPKLMFHGTASGPNGGRLRSILKHGLIPSAPKAWADDPNAKQARQRSRATYGGVYFAANPRVAFSSVHQPRGNDKSQYPVIVTAVVQPRAALPDEDDYTHNVDHAYSYATKTSNHDHTDGYYYLCLFLPGYGDKDLAEARERFAESMSGLLKRYGVELEASRLKKFTDPVFDAEVVRRVSTQPNDWYGFKGTVQSRALEYFKYRLETPKELEELPVELREQPTYEAGESVFRSALDALTRATKRVAIGLESHGDGGGRFRHTLRVMEPVTFRGRNRITSVVSLPDYYSRSTGSPVTVVAHYGDPEPVVSYLKSEGYDVSVVQPSAAVSAAVVQWADPPEYGHSDYKTKGGKMVYMAPSEFLSMVPELVIDEASEDNINDLVDVMQRRAVDPPMLLFRDGELLDHDGRHRAVAAMRLGLRQIPVLVLGAPSGVLRAGSYYTDESRRFWGSQGAGAVFLAEDTGRVLIQHRSSAVNEPGTWGVIGGAIDSGEQPKEAMEREAREETGYHGPMNSELIYTFQSGKFRYYNFLVRVPREFEPQLGWESQGYVWTTLDELPEPLHFGFKALLPSLRSALGQEALTARVVEVLRSAASLLVSGQRGSR